MNIIDLILQEFNERKIESYKERKTQEKLADAADKLEKSFDEEQKNWFKDFDNLSFQLNDIEKEYLVSFVLKLFDIL